MRDIAPVTPGALLLEDFMIPMGIDQTRLAYEINVPEERIAEIISGRQAVTVETDLRLCRFFGLSDGYWMRTQVFYDAETKKESMQESLAAIEPWASHAQARNNNSA